MTRVLVFIFALFCSLQAFAIKVVPFNYPEKDPYRATLAAAVLRSAFDDLNTNCWCFDTPEPIRDLVKPQFKSFDLHLGRRKLDVDHDRGNYRFPITLYRRAGRAPIIYLIPGLGSDNKNNVAMYLAEKFYRYGYHVVIVPSSYHHRFSLSASKTGIVGVPDQDAKDMYRALRIVHRWVVKHYRIPVSSVNLAGFSAGAYISTILKVIDEKQRKLNFKKVIALNPPFSINYGMLKIDKLQHKDTIGISLISVLFKAIKEILSFPLGNFILEEKYIPTFYRQLTFNQKQTKKAVAEVLSSSASETSQMATYVYRKAKPHMRFKMAKKVSNWRKYIFKILVPYWKHDVKKSERNFRNRLRSERLINYIYQMQNKSGYYIFHNEDDFLIRKKNLNKLHRLMKNKMVVFPHGGHMGNVWHRKYDYWLKRVMLAPGHKKTRPKVFYRYGQ